MALIEDAVTKGAGVVLGGKRAALGHIKESGHGGEKPKYRLDDCPEFT